MTEPRAWDIITNVEALAQDIGELCNGSTYDSDSYCLGSNPSSPASCLHGQAVKTLPSQGKIMGSIPIGGATSHRLSCGFFFLSGCRFPRAQMPLCACRMRQSAMLPSHRQFVSMMRTDFLMRYPCNLPMPQQISCDFSIFCYAPCIE